LMRDVGFKPATDIKAGIKRFIAWFKDYHSV
jgi:nucleoside-diphosphate-sugar epimerase